MNPESRYGKRVSRLERTHRYEHEIKRTLRNEKNEFGVDWSGVGAALDLVKFGAVHDRVAMSRAIGRVIEKDTSVTIIARTLHLAAVLDFPEISESVEKLEKRALSHDPAIKQIIEIYHAYRRDDIHIG